MDLLHYLGIFYWGAQHLTWHSVGFSPGLSRGGGSWSSTCFSWYSPACCWTPLCKHGLLAYGQLAIHQDPTSFPAKLLSSSFSRLISLLVSPHKTEAPVLWWSFLFSGPVNSCFTHWEPEYCSQFFICGFASAEWRVNTSSHWQHCLMLSPGLPWLAFFLYQKAVLLAHGHVGVHEAPYPLLLWSFSAELLSSWRVSKGCWWMSYNSSPGAAYYISFSQTSQGSPLPISPVCWSASEWQHDHLFCKSLLPVSHHLQTSCGWTLSIIQVNCIAPVSTSGVHQWLQASRCSTCQWWQSSGPSHLAGFQFITLFTCLDSASSACLQDYGDSVNCSFFIHPAVILVYKSHQVS